MNGVDPLLVSTVEEMIAELCPLDDVRAGGWPQRLASAWVAADLHSVGLPESVGGAGGTSLDAAAIVRAAGCGACPLPVADQALTGRWLAAEAGIELPDGLVSAATTVTDGTLLRVPWARETAVSIGVDGAGRVFVVEAVDADRGANLAGEPRDLVRIDGAPAAEVDQRTALLFQARLAAGRVLLLAGACDRVLALTVRYAAQRTQFGRRINAFQAVASLLAQLAEEAAMVSAAADLVAQVLDQPDALIEEAAVAKVVAGWSGSRVARLAHQVHGAMGVTEEYDLQLFTRRIWSWRDECGAEAVWARAVGRRVIQAGTAGAWDVVCAEAGATA